MSSPSDFIRAAAGLQVGTVPRRPTKNPSPTARWLRTVRGELTQEKFAAALELDRTTVADWERGANAPEWPSVQKILAKFPNAAPFPGSAAQPDGSTAMSDPDRRSREESNGGYIVGTREAGVVAEELDAIGDPSLRRYAMTKAMLAIEEARRNPLELGLGKRPDHAQRK